MWGAVIGSRLPSRLLCQVRFTLTCMMEVRVKDHARKSERRDGSKSESVSFMITVFYAIASLVQDGRPQTTLRLQRKGYALLTQAAEDPKP